MSTEELWEAEVYINEYSDMHSGLQLLEEVLNRENPFFPIHFQKGGFALIQKHSVVYMILEDKDISSYEEYRITRWNCPISLSIHSQSPG